jgi:hypothetical protein
LRPPLEARPPPPIEHRRAEWLDRSRSPVGPSTWDDDLSVILALF